MVDVPGGASGLLFRVYKIHGLRVLSPKLTDSETWRGRHSKDADKFRDYFAWPSGPRLEISLARSRHIG